MCPPSTVRLGSDAQGTARAHSNTGNCLVWRNVQGIPASDTGVCSNVGLAVRGQDSLVRRNGTRRFAAYSALAPCRGQSTGHSRSGSRPPRQLNRPLGTFP